MSAIDNATFQDIDVTAVALERDAFTRVPRTLALRHDILALSSDGNQLTIALPDENDRETIERVRFATGMHVRAVRASQHDIRARLAGAYPEQPESMLFAARDRASDLPAVRTLDAIHASAAASLASDVHIEPSPCGGRVRERVDGILRETRVLTPELFTQIVSRIKLLAGMDIADKRQPQDGRYALEVEGRTVDARVSSMPTVHGERLAIRLLDHRARVPRLEELGMPAAVLDRFRRAVHLPHGFIVVCGPTGSGKTTTLYAALGERNDDANHLCSVEDPVEVLMPGVAQVQVNTRAGVTFATALRAFLRQDPNVLMVGEMRDDETAAVAASAALSGQLVMTSMHANNALTAIERLAELGVDRATLAASCTAIVAQRLVRRVCTSCRGGHANWPADRKAGCEQCAGTGYSGRTAIFESLFLDPGMQECIAAGAPASALAQTARSNGYEPMDAHALRRVAAGETTIDEVRRVLSFQGCP